MSVFILFLYFFAFSIPYSLHKGLFVKSYPLEPLSSALRGLCFKTYATEPLPSALRGLCFKTYATEPLPSALRGLYVKTYATEPLLSALRGLCAKICYRPPRLQNTSPGSQTRGSEDHALIRHSPILFYRPCCLSFF